MPEVPVKIRSAPGIKRDGTVLEGENYIDGQWCRFQRGRPRKMGGYQRVTDTVPEYARGMTSFSSDGARYLHIGGESQVNQYVVSGAGTLSAQNDRTPGGFVTNAAHLWQFDHFYDSVAVVTDVVAHPGRNLTNIDSSAETPIYIGDVTAAGALVDSTLISVSGGIVTLGPYLMAYGNSGQIAWSAVNDPTTLDSEAFITQQKIVKGLPLRGAGQGPAGLFWSLDALIRATFTDAVGVVWNFDTIASDISILSSQSVVEYDGTYFWPGVDRWMLFNGVVRDIPNDFNINYFFDNLNFSQRQKVFGFKVPRFGEIWWCYPRGNATECTHAVVFNVKEGYWYDTELPLQDMNAPAPSSSGRTAGIYARVYNKPFMVGAENVGTIGTPAYELWQHETGVDKIAGSNINAIPSSFETAEIGMPVDDQQPSNNELRVGRLEPDFVQSGNMTLTVKGRVNSKADVVESDPFTIFETASAPTEETVKLREIRRLMSFKFESNVQGGNYEFGETLAHIETTGERVES